MWLTLTLSILTPLIALAVGSFRGIHKFSFICLGLGVSGIGLHRAFSPAGKSDIQDAIILDPVLSKVPPLDVATLPDIGRQTHILIVGDTGAGKSTLARAVATNLPGQVEVLDPHAAPGDWLGLTVIGMGRDYLSVNNAMKNHLNLMDIRYSQRAHGKADFPAFNIICDEFVAIASRPECDTSTQWFIGLGCEARKVNMRLVLMTQSDDVKSLDIEGQGRLRNNFSIVRLGKFAIEYAKKLNPEIMQFINQQEWPALLNDKPLIVPPISIGSTPVQPALPERSTPLTELPQRPEAERLNALLDKPFSLPEPSEPWQLRSPFETEIHPETRARVVSFKRSGKSSQEIIESTWGVDGKPVKKGGSKAYKAAYEIYQQIIKDL